MNSINLLSSFSVQAAAFWVLSSPLLATISLLNSSLFCKALEATPVLFVEMREVIGFVEI